ncbi:class I SAM-dependent methyltransferase [Trichothermofontia sp.]
MLVERTVPGLHSFLLTKLPELSKSSNILDIGCGTGAWLKRLSNCGFKNLYGLDIDTNQFQPKDIPISQVNFDVPITNSILDNKEFQLITVIEVIEHLESPGNLFRFIADHLDSDGYCLLTTPNIHSIDCRLRFLITGKLKSFDEKGDPTHIYPVLITGLYRILPRYSLHIVNRWGYPEKGSLVSRPITQLASGVLSIFLPQVIAGDTLCLLLKKKK